MNKSSHVKKILITADTVGGVWTYVVELIKSLKPYQLSFFLATMGSPLSNFQQEQIKNIGNVSLYESGYKLEWMENPWEDVKDSGRWLLEIEKEIQPDIIHLNGYSHASLPFNAPKLVVAHSCVFSWFKAVWNNSPDDRWNKYRIEVSNGLQSADVVTAPSYAMLSVLKDIYGEFVSEEPIYNCVDPNDFLPKQKESFILSAGRIWDEAKNIKALIDAAPHINWPVYIAGDKYHPVNNNSVSFEKISTGISEKAYNTYWIGCLSRKELSEYMSRASIFVLPALYEPFGLSILEAAYSGCALILSDIPSLREIWKDSAIFVNPVDRTGLIDAINNLISDKKMLGYYSVKARDRAYRFTPEIMAEKYLTLYNKLVLIKERI